MRPSLNWGALAPAPEKPKAVTSRKELSLEGVSVFLAMPSHRDLHPYTAVSLLETQAMLMARGVPCDIEVQYGSSLVHHARSKAAHRFLSRDKNRLFWVDSDIVWKASDFIRLLALSTVMDVVAGVYPAKQDEPLFFVNADLGKDFVSNEYGCFSVDGLGLGFTCVTRPVMQALADRAPKCRFHDVGPEPIPHPFRCDDLKASDGALDARGEDIAFFHDLKALGHQVWLDPSVKLSHVGAKVYTASFLEQLTKVEETPNGEKCAA